METFETFNNNQKINLKLSFDTIAVRANNLAVFLRKEDNLTDFEMVNETTIDTAKIDKDEAAVLCILEINSQFKMDQGQMPNRDKIIKSTSVTYSVYDQDNRKTYYSTYLSNEDEFVDGGSNTFAVIKRIKIVLNQNFLDAHKAFIDNLNLPG